MTSLSKLRGNAGPSPNPRLSGQRKVRFTLKAFQEIGRLGTELDEGDASDVLPNLTGEIWSAASQG